MADSQTQQPVDQQVTSKTPTTRLKDKNPKRVAAGKLIAEKTKPARAAQKKALAEAQVIIANNQLKPAVGPPAAPVAKNVLTTTQWLSVISIVVSLAGIYYKREEIKGFLTKKPPLPPPVPPNGPVDLVPKRGPPPVPPNSPVDFAPKRGIKPMD